ncbi:MAG TPA: dihydropteroate synthase [Bacteroidia bacterium]|nr:dihydropteroate synthase [Bacteroidia bacterium]
MSAQDTVFLEKKMLDCGVAILDLSSPAVMGILNLTPDSFYDGGKYVSEKKVFEQIEKIISEGADIIDIGAVSTRPKADFVSEEEELKRLLPIIELVRKKYPKQVISVDTFRAEVAKKSVAVGANIINDISGGTMDEKMLETVAKLNVPYVLMHIKGTPETMQDNPQYENVCEEVKNYFSEKCDLLKKMDFQKIILDPGFGFGKNMQHNFTLLKYLTEFQSFGLPILAGISRKSMIQKALTISAAEALNATTSLNTIALLNGANFLRVHDVKEAKEVIRLFDFYRKTDASS